MDIKEGYTILLSGDGYLMKNFIAKNSGGDKAMAASLVGLLRKEAAKARNLGILLILAGIPAIVVVVGLFAIPMGIWRISQASRANKVIDQGYALWMADNP